MLIMKQTSRQKAAELQVYDDDGDDDDDGLNVQILLLT